MRMSASNGVMSDHQSRTALQDIQPNLTVFSSGICRVASSISGIESTRGFASLKVVRFVKVGEPDRSDDQCSDILNYSQRVYCSCIQKIAVCVISWNSSDGLPESKASSCSMRVDTANPE
jgi:hypothetical protein